MKKLNLTQKNGGNVVQATTVVEECDATGDE